jgi:hypothetical protein
MQIAEPGDGQKPARAKAAIPRSSKATCARSYRIVTPLVGHRLVQECDTCYVTDVTGAIWTWLQCRKLRCSCTAGSMMPPNEPLPALAARARCSRDGVTGQPVEAVRGSDFYLGFSIAA